MLDIESCNNGFLKSNGNWVGVAVKVNHIVKCQMNKENIELLYGWDLVIWLLWFLSTLLFCIGTNITLSSVCGFLMLIANWLLINPHRVLWTPWRNGTQLWKLSLLRHKRRVTTLLKSCRMLNRNALSFNRTWKGVILELKCEMLYFCITWVACLLPLFLFNFLKSFMEGSFETLIYVAPYAPWVLLYFSYLTSVLFLK